MVPEMKGYRSVQPLLDLPAGLPISLHTAVSQGDGALAVHLHEINPAVIP